jgi:hypothetical protein
MIPVPEFMDPVFAKTRPKRSLSMTETESFGLVFAKTGSINSGTGFFFISLLDDSLNDTFCGKVQQIRT